MNKILLLSIYLSNHPYTHTQKPTFIGHTDLMSEPGIEPKNLSTAVNNASTCATKIVYNKLIKSQRS